MNAAQIAVSAIALAAGLVAFLSVIVAALLMATFIGAEPGIERVLAGLGILILLVVGLE